MGAEEWKIVWFSLWTACCSTLLILPAAIGLAWLLARKNWFGKSLVETLVAMPLVMPPVATGLILLKLFGKRGPLGPWLEPFFQIVFTWRGVVLAMAVMSFPLLVRGARIAFEQVNPRLEQVASTLGVGFFRIFFAITLPLAARGILAGAILAFARALGEFGATILVAGNIPGKTTTLSVSIYSHIQLGEDAEAFNLLLVSAALAFFVVWIGERLFRPAFP